ncbi:MAG: M12 family metallo-peptidase [Planctomycetota bacterium]|jgi:hypothetical protein
MTTHHRRTLLGIAGLAACLFATPAFGQGISLMHTQANEALSLSKSTLVTLDLSAVILEEPFEIDLPLGEELLTLDLQPNSVRSADYRVVVPGPDGVLQEVEPGPSPTYRGSIVGVPTSRSAVGVAPDGLYGVIHVDDAEYWVQPVPGSNDGAHVIYEPADILPIPGSCGTLAEAVLDFREQPPANDGSVAGACNSVTQVGVDADFPYFQNYGSVNLVEIRINVIFNTMNLQYDEDVDIIHEITTIIVRTTAGSDPYSSSSASTLLNQFANHWNSSQGGVPRDVAHLFTGRELNGGTIGIAFLGVICITSNAYGLAQSDYTGNFNASTNLSAHELGHNWAADHCSCSSYTMNPTNNTSNQFHPSFTIPQIVSFRNSRWCLTNVCTPSNDDCSDAESVSTGTTSFSNENATTDGPSDNLCSANGSAQVENDVWYVWTAECDGIVNVDLCTSTYDTRLAIYEGGCPSGVNQAIACNDNFCGDGSGVEFESIGGVDYLIRIGGTNGAEGAGIMDITSTPCIPEPPNNNCGSSSPILDGDTAFTTIGATTDGPAEDCGDIELDVWYRYVATCDGQATISVCDADYDAALAAYVSSCPSSPSAIACSEDSCGDGPAITFPVTGGSVYRVRVGGSGGAGSGTISVDCGEVVDCPSDTNSDGVTDVQDLTNVILAWGSDDADADVNSDGIVDVQDLTEVILAWGDC